MMGNHDDTNFMDFFIGIYWDLPMYFPLVFANRADTEAGMIVALALLGTAFSFRHVDHGEAGRGFFLEIPAAKNGRFQ